MDSQVDGSSDRSPDASTLSSQIRLRRRRGARVVWAECAYYCACVVRGSSAPVDPPAARGPLPAKPSKFLL
ncbi:unnamed protein product [Pieris brassicae]|uniref:Uncharacterized protein n=1 Tax=Pieris brassicae TaxID=7116 RepID=A0A9P0TDG6_PIEBR|nr:unnamed protein product [Pieris brassicae]